MMNDNYEPIMRKIRSWVDYERNRPKSDYVSNPQEHDNYRSRNDLDCVLTNGNLNADTIFSLWSPLRLALVLINGYPKLNEYADINNKPGFLEKINQNDTIEELLPIDNTTVKLLIELFNLGQQRCNVMILPDRTMQSRGKAPYYDYMPYFLYECFDNGAFGKYFESNDDLLHWINEEKLQMFFDGEIKKDRIRDLAGTGSITKNIPTDIDTLINNYIGILKIRNEILNIH